MNRQAYAVLLGVTIVLLIVSLLSGARVTAG